MKNNIELHKDICEKIHELYIKKNNDYGNSVSDTYKKFGMNAYLVRMYDKLNRLYAMTRDGAVQQVQDEQVEDTLLDLANYAIIARIELEMDE